MAEMADYLKEPHLERLLGLLGPLATDYSYAILLPPTGSYVAPFWVWYGFLVRDYTILPKKELEPLVHRRLQDKASL